MTRQYDAIMIGGGPAGAIAALHLAQCGWRVLLVERRLPGRGKTCGHCLSARAFPMLERAGVAHLVSGISRGRTRSFRLHTDDDRTLTVPLHGERDQHRGVLVERHRFDRALLSEAARAGVEIIQPAAASMVDVGNDRTTVVVQQEGATWHAHAPLVIGADGLRSRVAQRAGLTQRGRRNKATKFGMSFAFTSEHAASIERGRIEMFLMRGAYLGVVNQGGGELHVAQLARKEDRRDKGTQGRRGDSPQRVARDFASRFKVLRRVGLGSLDRRDMRHLAGAAPMPWRTRRVASDRIALVGDAAGYIEPFTGEGMTWAIESAEALAEVLADVPAGCWSVRQVRQYRALWRARVASRQRRCGIIARLIEYPALVRFGCRLTQQRPELSGRMLQRLVPA